MQRTAGTASWEAAILYRAPSPTTGSSTATADTSRTGPRRSSTPADADHIALHGPDTVLRRVAAERGLLTAHLDDGWGNCTSCATAEEAEFGERLVQVHVPSPHPCAVVTALARAWGWEGPR
ncbi:DUF6221 family protein [Streptacidiphilus sp. N1-12]|uniref:DUF6221 family protein n=2 Tax=Streptacidiphilus alkalitolerans TaxID=3342712 RepID=A0ABV6V9Y4_9ACTN